MTDKKIYPLSIRNVSPGDGAILLTGTHPNGWDDGVHTGGAWELGEYVYKPLDGRPNPDAQFHVETNEEAVLTFMAGRPMFPKNWEVVEANGRRFIKRQKAYVYDSEETLGTIQTKYLLAIEQGVLGLNAAQWEVNDLITVAQDPSNYEYFVLDMSNAQKMTGTGAFAATDEDQIYALFERANRGDLVKLRNQGRDVLEKLLTDEQRYVQGYYHVYASFNRPVDASWRLFPTDSLFIHTDRADWSQMRPHTWIVTKQPITAEVIKSYELTWAWEPLHK